MSDAPVPFFFALCFTPLPRRRRLRSPSVWTSHIRSAPTTPSELVRLRQINFTTRKYGSQLLPELHDLSPAPVYIRAHHLLTSGDGLPKLKWSSTNVFTLDASGKPVYDFNILDQIFDEYKAPASVPWSSSVSCPRTSPPARTLRDALPGDGQGLRAKPAEGLRHVGRTLPPGDRAFRPALRPRASRHLVLRGMERAGHRLLEGHAAEYLKLYDYSVAGVRKALPTASVGGPAQYWPRSQRAITFLANFLTHCANDKRAATGGPIPLDFITFHPKGSPRLIPATADQPAHIRMGISNELNAAANGFRTVAASAKFHNLPIILSEADPEGCAACSAKENPANAYRNGPLFPAYTAAAMKSLLDLAADAKVNLIGMLTWSFEFEGKQYFEGFRTLATNGVDKPVLNVFRMAGLFSGDRVAAARQPPFRRRRSPSPACATSRAARTSSMSTPSRRSPRTRPPSCCGTTTTTTLLPPSASVAVTITGIPAGVHVFLLDHFRIDDTHSNAYTGLAGDGFAAESNRSPVRATQAAGQLAEPRLRRNGWK